MDECIDLLGEAQIFSTSDVDSGYWQLEMDNKKVEKSMFVTTHGLFKNSQILFGLRNTSTTFQRLMNVILASAYGKTLLYTLMTLPFSQNHQKSTCST